MTIRDRVGLSMAFMGFLLALAIGFGLYGMSSINRSMNEASEVTIPAIDALGNAEIDIGRSRFVYDKIALQPTAPGNAELRKQASALLDQSDDWFRKYEALPCDAEDERLALALRQSRAELRKVIADFGIAVENYNQGEVNRISLDALPKAYSMAADASSRLKQSQLQKAKRQNAANARRYRIQQMVGAGLMLIGVAAAAAGWIFLRRAIVKPLDEALDSLQEIANGDLSRAIAIRGKDEMSKLMQGIAGMQHKLASTVGNVRLNAEAIAAASKQIATGNADLSSRTEEQAASLQETAASLEQLTVSVKQNSESASRATGLAGNAREVALEGSQIVERVVETMGDIEQSSGRIGEIIGVIDSIAFQTNILALNAAVEAARAGEQGRGFAVVASEVRALAQRSSSAAKEIKELIDESSMRVRSGSELVGRAGGTMTQISSAIQRVTDIVEAIATASGEQARGIEQINEAVSQMDGTTQQNAALVEQAAGAASAMERQASTLRGEVAIFRVA
ncbi:methyl-accepting chemotaxis protein [Paraburkholderia lacunae]|nr:methyl-accepting chemotaxis protein [Paraburkholderia lacunae]